MNSKEEDAMCVCGEFYNTHSDKIPPEIILSSKACMGAKKGFIIHPRWDSSKAEPGHNPELEWREVKKELLEIVGSEEILSKIIERFRITRL